jgi:uncharacterized membrane protein
MDRHDKALLDKQLWGIDPPPPSLIGLAFVAVFLAGIIIGSVLFAREYEQAGATSIDVTGSISPLKPRRPVPDSKTEH